MRLSGVVLAAGRSQRMGEPKALLPVQGTTMLMRMVETMRAGCGDDIVVVLGHEAARLRRAVPAAVRIVENPLYDLGMLSSLQAGLEASAGADFVLFTPVDLPGLQPSTVRAVAAACRASVAIVKPRWQGRRGHPVALGPDAVQALAAADPCAVPRDILSRFADATVCVDVDDLGICQDVDNPDEYQAFLKAAVR